MLMSRFIIGITKQKSYAVRENAGIAQLKIRSKMDNVAGVQLPVFESFSEGADGEIPNCLRILDIDFILSVVFDINSL